MRRMDEVPGALESLTITIACPLWLRDELNRRSLPDWTPLWIPDVLSDLDK